MVKVQSPTVQAAAQSAPAIRAAAKEPVSAKADKATANMAANALNTKPSKPAVSVGMKK